jgi:arylsulfatase A-like enzyme
MLHIVLSLALSAQVFSGNPHIPERPVRKPPPNIVVIIADDLGVDLVRSYGESPEAPCTTHMDLLASQGLLFRNCWANPVCSPARAALLTGRYGVRTGIGKALMTNEPGLSLAETTLPEILQAYQSAAVGKWHLSGNSGLLHPNETGFDHFAGFMNAELINYFNWPKVVDGVSSQSTTYSTIDITNEAIASMSTMQEPWFLYVAYNAPHTPIHVPPAELCENNLCPGQYCSNLTGSSDEMEKARAMVESLDSEIGRLLATLDTVDPNAYVFLLSDNGTGRPVSIAPFLPAHAKATAYEGGVNVPLIVRGPGVATGECDALVSIVDLYATIADIAGVPSVAEDSVSFVPCLANPSASPRPDVYTELFTPTGGGPLYADHLRAAREARYKLIREVGHADEFYDLLLDPFESTNLLPTLNTNEQAAFDALEAAFAALGVD